MDEDLVVMARNRFIVVFTDCHFLPPRQAGTGNSNLFKIPRQRIQRHLKHFSPKEQLQPHYLSLAALESHAIPQRGLTSKSILYRQEPRLPILAGFARSHRDVLSKFSAWNCFLIVGWGKEDSNERVEWER